MRDINWFPGHMAKTRRQIEDCLPLADLVFETCDARIPISSQNPELQAQIRGKLHILLLTKGDLADPEKTRATLRALRAQGREALELDLLNGRGLKELVALAREKGEAVLRRAREKGRISRPLRVMVVGIPNSGKSTLINRLVRRRAARVEDRPGVTRSRQWVKSEGGFELMDMPGTLWPNLGSLETKLHLAMTGAIRDEVLDLVELAFAAANTLCGLYPGLMSRRFLGAEDFSSLSALEEADEVEQVGLRAEDEAAQEHRAQLLRFEAMGRYRGCLRKGGKVDEERFAKLLLSEFRTGQIGRISLETLR